MKGIAFFFEVHQPMRIAEFRSADIGKGKNYFWEEKNREIINRVVDKCYIPATQHFIDNRIKASFSISGVLLERLLDLREDAVDLFREYFRKVKGELLAETYYHSLASLWNEEEFVEQVEEDRNLKKYLFNVQPRSFRNTEMIYNDYVGSVTSKIGFSTILTEGVDRIIKDHSPNYRYRNPSGQTLLLRNYRLSDDISFRFSNVGWNEYPLMADKYAKWLSETPGDVINLFMDYETFGEHQWKESGIFDFLDALPGEVERRGMEFITVNEASKYPVKDLISVQDFISWADYPRDLSAWLANEMQRDAFEDMKNLSGCRDRKKWRYLQTSDHFYYMSLAGTQDQEVHSYFNPYGSPYDAYINYKNIIQDFRENCK
ncbi:MAG: glycoside hydrolase family 57 protein [Candidatus Thermoplasmatota archaeon]|jgi:alpha-amylase|nr:glycoside hydrolase family 57 protein [Candidatus Thermoplasmatota archaeon]